MKRFIIKYSIFALIFIAVNVFLLFVIPKDNNSYLCEYNHKIHLMGTVSQPRIIFIGGSNIAFGIDSKTLKDSLHLNVVNMGLHGGIGIRYPLEDCLQYVKKGDVVVFQFEYGNFLTNGNGNMETFPAFMVATDWRNCKNLNHSQWLNIIKGVPRESFRNVVRFAKFLICGSFDSSAINKNFDYSRSGFNEFGDEVSHIHYPNIKYVSSGKPSTKGVDEDFMDWLAKIILQYERLGVKLVMLPPVCIESCFKISYNDNISRALDSIHHPYIVSPWSMVLDDSCTFDTGYHVNKEGIRQNTANIIKSLKFCK